MGWDFCLEGGMGWYWRSGGDGVGWDGIGLYGWSVCVCVCVTVNGFGGMAKNSSRGLWVGWM